MRPEITFLNIQLSNSRNHLAANNLTYMGYLNRKGVTKPEDGKDIPCYAEDIGKCIMEYMEHLQ